jgi:IPTL-CTERM motif
MIKLHQSLCTLILRRCGMVTKNMFSVFVAAFFISCIFFLTLPEKGYSGIEVIATGCCINEGGCVNFGDGDGLVECIEDTVLVDGTCTVEGPDGICTNNITRSNAVPTLSEWGLIAMAGILGIAGYIVISRRRVNV